MRSTLTIGGSYGAGTAEGVLEPSLKRQGTRSYSGENMKVIVPEMLFRMPVKAIRVWVADYNIELDSTLERNHNPQIMVKRITRDYGDKELELVLSGDYHIENLTYFRKPKSEWVTFGAIYLTLPEGLRLATMLLNLLTFNQPDHELEKACSSLLRLRQLQV
jgi:hypothetical protein